jgi:hypothetical protein
MATKSSSTRRSSKTKVTDIYPKVLVTREQYVEDIKVRWKIHQIESKLFIDDCKKGVTYVRSKLQSFYSAVIAAAP